MRWQYWVMFVCEQLTPNVINQNVISTHFLQALSLSATFWNKFVPSQHFIFAVRLLSIEYFTFSLSLQCCLNITNTTAPYLNVPLGVFFNFMNLHFPIYFFLFSFPQTNQFFSRLSSSLPFSHFVLPISSTHPLIHPILTPLPLSLPIISQPKHSTKSPNSDIFSQHPIPN